MRVARVRSQATHRLLIAIAVTTGRCRSRRLTWIRVAVAKVGERAAQQEDGGRRVGRGGHRERAREDGTAREESHLLGRARGGLAVGPGSRPVGHRPVRRASMLSCTAVAAGDDIAASSAPMTRSRLDSICRTAMSCAR